MHGAITQPTAAAADFRYPLVPTRWNDRFRDPPFIDPRKFFGEVVIPRGLAWMF